MKAVILAGGKGERLRPLTDNIPKPMMPIIDKPILEYIVRLLREHGIIDIVMTLGYKGEIIRKHFLDGSSFGVNITYSQEFSPLGTAGAIKSVEKYIDDDFVIMSGDTLTNIDLTSLITFHSSHDSLVTMATKRMKKIDGFGVVDRGDDGKILDFVEKPISSNLSLVNMGIYVAKRELFDYIKVDTYLDLSMDIFPSILPYMYAYISDCYWSDIGTLSAYYLTNNFVATRRDVFIASV